jgi:hypothetical protein
MTRRRAWAPFAVLASLALAALLLSGLRAGPVRAYAVGVPSVRQVAVARPHHQACEGLIQFTAKLRSTVAGDQRVTVCVSDRGGELKLRGSTSGYSGVSIAGSQPLRAFAMVALEPEQHSLLGSLGLAFSRASLFRPSWVRPWTFWILLILLLGTLPLAAVAIASAMRSESNDGDHA